MNPYEELIEAQSKYIMQLRQELKAIENGEKYNFEPPNMRIVINQLNENLPEAIKKHNQEKLDGLGRWDSWYDGGIRPESDGDLVKYEDVQKAFCE